MSRLGAFGRGIASLAALGALLVGVPALLVRFGQWPRLEAPTGGWWGRAADTVVSDSTVFVVLTLAAGLVWALFAVAVAVEAAAGLRGRPAPRIVLAGALQRPARMLVIGLLMTLSVSRTPTYASPSLPATSPTTPASALIEPDAVASVAPLPRPPVIATTPSDALVVSPTSPPDGEPGTSDRSVVVRHGDSAWQLAETHLGDGMHWRELWSLNHDVVQPDGRTWTDPQVIRPGWELHLPPEPSAASVTQDDREAAEIDHVVVPGDTLSGIAQRYLGDLHRYPELFDANEHLTQPDGRHLTDPDLIRPGWRITIPDRAATPAQDVPLEPQLPPPPPPPVTTSPPDTVAPSTTTTSPATTTSNPETVPAGPGTSPPPAAPAPTPTAPPSTVDHAPEAGRAPLLAGISGALVIATGIAVRAIRLRRRRHLRGARHTRISATPTETTVLAAADVPLVRWAGQCLARMVSQLNRHQLTAGPVAVELSQDTGLEVLWDRPQAAAAPPGWASADGGWAWRHPYDPDADVPADELPAAIPALVTIGQRDGRQLLIDLEAFGSLGVTGPRDQVEAFLRSLAAELATGDDLSDAYVHTVDVHAGLGPHSHRGTAATIEAVLTLAHATATSVRDGAGGCARPDTFRARAGDPTPLEATVIIADRLTPDYCTDLAAAAAPRSSVTVVLGDATIGITGAEIALDATGAGRLEPLGLTFDAVGVPAGTTERVAETLTVLAADPEDEPVGDGADHVGPIDAPPCGDGHVGLDATASNGHSTHGGDGADRQLPEDDGTPLEFEAERLFDPDPGSAADLEREQMVVRVLGVPTISERPNLGRRELVLAVLLACRAGSLAATAVQDALWGGRPVEAKTVWNFVASARRSLGTFADAAPVMPAADRARGRLRLDPRVTTDLAVLTSRLDQARTASSSEAIRLLRDGLALIEGPPFDAAGYDWAHRDQDVAQASMVIEQAVELLVDLALDAGLTDTARAAVTRGLRGLPGDEQLYRARMRVEHHAGQHTAVAAAYDELTVYLADFDLEPSPTTTALFHDLVRHQHA